MVGLLRGILSRFWSNQSVGFYENGLIFMQNSTPIIVAGVVADWMDERGVLDPNEIAGGVTSGFELD